MSKQKITSFLFLAVGVSLSAAIAFGVQNRKIDDNALKNAGKSDAPGEWLTYGLNYQEQRYSLLKEINASNVGRLGLVWTYEIGQGGGNQEATPLVANGVLYSITNWSITFALDARTGKEVWRYDPKVDRAVTQPKICCGIVNRGVAIYQGKILVPVIDGRLVALDAANGKQLWSVQTTPPGEDYSMTMAPRVAKGKVIVGNAGAEYPVRGFVTAYDVETGKQAWRFYTVPGDPKKGFENKAMADAAKTWSGEWWKFGGGGTAWDGMAYDPESNLFYFGTGNGGPWPSEVRQSKGLDNLYVCSIIAVDADSGAYKWHYQVVPEDSWDYDSVQQLTLADIRIDGQPRKVLMQANKDGFFYVIDRLTGKLISAEPFAQVNWASGVDLKTGRPMIRPEARYTKERSVSISPGPGGAHNWAPMAFSPETNLIYLPASGNGGMSYRVADTFEYQPGRTNMGTSFGGAGGPGGFGGPGGPGAPGGRGAPPAPGAATGGILEPGAAIGAGFNVPTGPAPGAAAAPPLPMIGPKDPQGNLYTGSWLIAIDPSTQKEKWRATGGGSIGGGALATAGNLVFQTLNNGRLLAYRADTGEKLLETSTNQSSGMGPPITFTVDGKQYVAVAGGSGPRGGFGGGGFGPGPGGPGGPGAPAGRGAAPPAPAPPAAPQGGPAPVLPRLYVYALDGKAENPTPAAAQGAGGAPFGPGGFGGPGGAPPAGGFGGPGGPGFPPAPGANPPAGPGGRGQ